METSGTIVASEAVAPLSLDAPPPSLPPPTPPAVAMPFEAVLLPWDPLLNLGPAARLRLNAQRKAAQRREQTEDGGVTPNGSTDDNTGGSSGSVGAGLVLSHGPVLSAEAAGLAAPLQSLRTLALPAGPLASGPLSRDTLARLGVEAAAAALLGASLRLAALRAQRLNQRLAAAVVARGDSAQLRRGAATEDATAGSGVAPQGGGARAFAVSLAELRHMLEQVSPAEESFAAEVDTRVLARPPADNPPSVGQRSAPRPPLPPSPLPPTQH
jgi:hypothetical protein